MFPNKYRRFQANSGFQVNNYISKLWFQINYYPYNFVTSFELDQKSDFDQKIAILIRKLEFLSLLGNFIKQNILTISQNDCVRSLKNPLNHLNLKDKFFAYLNYLCKIRSLAFWNIFFKVFNLVPKIWIFEKIFRKIRSKKPVEKSGRKPGKTIFRWYKITVDEPVPELQESISISTASDFSKSSSTA